MEKSGKVINNAFYDDLKEEWMEREDHPIALLRAENQIRNPWIAKVIKERKKTSAKVLDIGCGGGLLTNYLAKEGHQVSGIDLSTSSLEIGIKNDLSKTVEYRQANAYALPYQNGIFDVVTAMDVLEHVENPEKVISEASRVLSKDGLFFFHTFNRNLLSYLLVIKGVEWFIPNTPKNMHVYPLFIKPKELQILCREHQLFFEDTLGLRPSFNMSFFWKRLISRNSAVNIEFTFSKSLMTGYCGFAIKSTV
ncbi:MAG: 3-demethylubiquinone-9 3-O-methyltransferase [Chlamydiae bacterium]|jgi:2-polyprenyl-6-hydroxyphenyl methylase/3-demethylubiquinone-9 3-methyltransferase|nr:3-demethylubiquinone-9 3-O-methyltransferase [Chlamydiota bacterium]